MIELQKLIIVERTICRLDLEPFLIDVDLCHRNLLSVDNARCRGVFLLRRLFPHCSVTARAFQALEKNRGKKE